jgi:hypothetical protein
MVDFGALELVLLRRDVPQKSEGREGNIFSNRPKGER